MAKVVLSGIFTDARGSMGGVTFQRNASGVIIRSRIKPVNKRTAYTGPVRANMQYINQLWRSLTEIERDVWRAAAIHPQNGYQLFQSQNQTAVKLLVPPVSAPQPPSTIVPNTYTFVADSATSSMKVNFNTSSFGSVIAYISVSPPLSAGIDVQPSSVRYVASIVAPSGTPDIASDYTNKFGFFPPQGASLTIGVQLADSNSLNYLVPVFQSVIVL